MFICLIITRGAFGIVANNDLKMLPIGVLGKRAPCVRSGFLTGTNLYSITMLGFISLPIRGAEEAIIPAVLHSLPTVIALAVS